MSGMIKSVTIVWIALMALSRSAYADETWTCVELFPDHHQVKSEIFVAHDLMMFKDGGPAYTIFENNDDHILAAAIIHDKDSFAMFYRLIERSSGRMTMFDDALMSALKGALGDVVPIPTTAACERAK